jgi:thiamine pyrophosphate-dependent acetolactate synthase large subunit-like protein
VLSRPDLLEPLARIRTDEVVVTTMSVVRPWGRLSSSPLDFASADSAMGHAADLALGIALARPDRRVVCLNGDGSMLMTLGTLATAADANAENLLLVVVNNGDYEITGHQPVTAGSRIDYAGLARAAGWPLARTFETADAWAEALPGLLEAPGPVLADVRVVRTEEGPIGRRPEEEAVYLRTSLAEWSRTLRAAL